MPVRARGKVERIGGFGLLYLNGKGKAFSL